MTEILNDAATDPQQTIADLQSRLGESLARETATAEVMRLINASPGDLAPVFDAIVEKAMRFCDAGFGGLWLVEDDLARAAATRDLPDAYIEFLTRRPVPQGEAFGPNIKDRPAVHIVDLAATESYRRRSPVTVASVELGAIRTYLAVPLRDGNTLAGVLSLYRKEVRPFTDQQIALVKTFADQAVIAIQNARLFKEAQDSTAEVTEALERQTATADILKVIASSPSDVQPVFEAIVERSNRLIGGLSTAVYSIIDDVMHLMAFTPISPQADAALQASFPRPLSTVIWGERSRNGEIVQIPDAQGLVEWAEMARLRGFRGTLFVPLLRDGATIGLISVTRKQPGTFAPHHVQLLQAFSDQAVIAIENARLFDEVQAKTRDLSESLQQQTATADVLKIISRSAFDLDAVMHTLARSAAELCAAGLCGLYIREDDFLVCRGYTAISKEQEEFVRRTQIPADDTNFYMNRALSSGEIANIGDFENDRSVGTRAFQEKLGFRSLLIVPLMREGHGIGLFVLGRDQVGEFSLRHVELVQTFADQAVIAIQNARLFEQVQAKTRDLSESLQQQTATADVLKIISRSAFDLQAVFDTLTASAVDLLGMHSGTICVRDGEVFRFRSAAGAFWTEELWRYLQEHPAVPARETAAGRVILSRRIEQIPDIFDDSEYALPMKALAPALAPRAMLGVPLLGKDRVEGAMVLSRQEPGPFTQREVDILQTFADQASIAIENARLFNETREALERQTATSDILNVIASSPTDTQPVFDAIARSAAVLCEGTNSGVFCLRDGLVHLAGHHNLSPEQLAFAPKTFPAPPHRGYMAGRAIIDRAVAHVPDIAADPEYSAESMVKAGFRSAVSVPMFRNGEPIGAINVTREEARPFSVRQIELLRTFADQAVIAIENVRLFDETNEALEQQKASADILSVISSSVADTRPVFDKILSSIEHLFGADERLVLLAGEDDLLHIGAIHGPNGERVRALFPVPLQGSASEVAIRDRRLVTHANVFNDPDVPPVLRETARRFGENYAMAVAPLLWEDRAIGSIFVGRTSMKAFDEKECALLRTFADQAVIAIQNARLFNETREALERQTATSDILNVIASSPTDVGPVLKAIVDSACELCEAYDAVALLKEGDYLLFGAHHGPIPIEIGSLLISRNWTPGLAVIEQKPVHIHDLLSSEGDQVPEAQRRAREFGYRTILSVPMLRENESIGVLALRRAEAQPFSDKQIALLQTFADQAVIAIGNVRLFEEVQARTRELAASLDDLRAAQDRLVQTEKLASLGQLTAGIAHEIKNPLNFVNNFSALSAELTDELNDVLKPVVMDGKVRADVDELTGLLKGNLEKVVQHGKRADSIVKNMLLHSREGSGEQRAADINALLDESLNLAYHGARAEKPEFNITLRRELDPDAGAIDVFPQEITRAFINLISNGFYAASKRKAENGETDFEPVLSAATRNFGNHVEIRIRDNGTGIPPEAKEKIFNPFFTTKPSGEGTGLGLSMSHDIIVKQHGGTIEVETEAGLFTEFKIVLPRTIHR